MISVQHNGTFDDTFSSRFVGSEYAQKYNGVGIRGNNTFVFGQNNPFASMMDDYKVERVSRLVTDVDSTYYNSNPEVLTNLHGTTLYRVGAGTSGYYDTQGNINWLATAWGAGLTAGVTQLAGSYHDHDGVYNIEYSSHNHEICTPEDALPSVAQQGDSGSQIFVYNVEEQSFELVGSLQGASSHFCISRYNPSATTAAIEYCTTTLATTVDTDGSDATTYYISGARVREGDQLIQDGEAATYLRQGSISLGGNDVAHFNGVALDEFAQGTWEKLDADSLTWYTYSDNDYINAKPDSVSGADAFGADDLFYTSNLHFKADAANGSTTAHRRIELTEHVDLGVGHVQFSLGDGTTAATYDLGQSAPNYFLSSAGFVVDAGVTLNNYFTYEKGRELRRVGAGTMNMVGQGNNDVLLNIGGGGTTFLNRTGGYAAYSALVNNKAGLKLADVGQVFNNVTLGANGGVLDFNGNDYRWMSGGARSEGAFGLTLYEGLNRVENSYVVNYASGTSSTITIDRTDDFEFAGAFRDGSSYVSGAQSGDSRFTMMPSVLIDQYKQFSASDRQESASTLRVVYNGGATMDMTGVYTLLTGESGLEVARGTVRLHGTNTIHAIGSETGTTLNRWSNAQDWHYAMAEMDVTVGRGGTFELGHHALLLGNVQVQSGGNLVMTQAVNERYEFVEGWYRAEDTYALSDYYGLKGDVSLAQGAEMTLRFDEGVATALSYGGAIRGEGSVTVAAGAGSVLFSGNNSFSGEKTVQSGKLYIEAGAEGDTTQNKWLIQSAGSLALESLASNADLMRLVAADSTGVLALTQNVDEQLSYAALIVGAAEGETVHYGSASSSLDASNGQWTLGGGGGTLMVDSLQEGANKLVQGYKNGTGTVVLTNSANSFNGGVDMVGKVTLGYTDAAALGNNVLSLGYGQSLVAVNGSPFAGSLIDAASDGMFALSGNSRAECDLSQHRTLSLAALGEASISGRLTVAEGAAYRLGGSGELTLATELSGSHGILVDGQGRTGSRVILATASSDTGAVVVQGYDSSKASVGEVTLSFTTDNALAAASSLSLKNNAGVDLNGTNQLFNRLMGDESSLIFDDKGGNALTLNYAENATLSTRVQAVGTDVVKTGSGTLILVGENLWKSLSIQEGIVQVADSKALGYLATGSQVIGVDVHAGGSLQFTQGGSVTNTLTIAGMGADGHSFALSTSGHLKADSLNVAADAAISGQFSFSQLNLQGHDLTVTGQISVTGVTAQGGSLILDDANFKVTQGNYGGSLTVGAGGATVEYPWNDNSTGAFNLQGFVSGTSADSMLKLVGYKHTINLLGGADVAGKVEVGNGLTLNVTKDASVGALVNEANVGDLSRVVVNATTLEITGGGNNFGTNDNPGQIELVNGGQLLLSGLADGASMGALGKLNLGSDGVLAFSSFSGYTGSHFLMDIATIEGSRSLQIDAAALSTLTNGATYHLLTSANDLSGWTLLNDRVGASRQSLELVAGGSEGAYTLDLKVSGVVAAATWKGTGTLVAGQANAANLSSTAGDDTFMAMDSLTITSDAGASDMLTLGGEIAASSITYTGAGTLTLAQQNGSKFATGLDVVIDGMGTLALGDTQAISGSIELKQGTLSASSASLNGTKGVRVTGDAHFELNSASHVTAGIDIAEGKNLHVTFKDGSMASQWGGNFDNNLMGNGSLLVDIGSGHELHLNGNHTAFTGNVEVQSGILQLGLQENGLSSAELGARNISIAQGATLSLSSAATTVAADIAWAGGSTLHVKDGVDNAVAYTFSGEQNLAGVLNISAAANKTVLVAGDITGAGSLNFSGPSTFILSGNNSYSGGTTLNNSGLTLYVASAHALGTGAVMGTSGRLVKTGYNELFINDFSFAGSTHVEQGTLALGIGSSSWSTGFSGEKNATLRLISTSAYGTTLKAGSSIGGGLSVELQGHFQYWDANTYTGGTKLLSGSLLLVNANALGSGALYAAKGTTVALGAHGAVVAGNSVVDDLSFEFGSLSVGTDDAAGHLHFNSISGTATPSFLLDVFSADSYDRLTGDLTPGSLLTVSFKGNELGSYQLVEGNALGATLSTSGEDTSRFSYVWNSSENGLTLTVYDVASGSANIWTGGSQGVWDASATPWHQGSYSADRKTLFFVHDDTAISVESAVATSALEAEVDAGATLSFNPNGGSISASSLKKDGAGTLILSGIFSMNAVDLLAGRLVVAADGALGSAAVTMAEGTTLYLAQGATVSNALSGSLTVGAVGDEEGCFSGNAASSLLTAGFTKLGTGQLTVVNSAGTNPAGAMLVLEGSLAYDAGSSSILGTVSGSGTFALVGGAVNANNINVGKLEVVNSILAYNNTFDGKQLEVSGLGAELRMGHWSSVNNSALILRDGGQLSMSSSGFNNSTVTVEGAGVIAVGETARQDDNPLLNVESTVSGSGTLYVTNYGSRAYTVNVNKVISDAAGGSLAVITDQSDLRFTVANSYSGGTTVNGGKLTAAVAGALGSGNVTVNGGELVLDLGATAQVFTIGSLSGTGGRVNIGGNTLIINQTENGHFDGSFNATAGASLLKRGEATLELAGSAASTNLQIDAGTVKLASTNVYDQDGMCTSVVTMNGGVFDLNGQTSGAGADCFMFDVASGYLAFRGSADMLVKDSAGTSGLGFNTEHADTAVSKRGSGRAEIAADIVSGGRGGAGASIGFGIHEGELVVSGNIGADLSVAEHHHFGIAKSGAGTMVLSGDNGYTGGTNIAAGTLIAASDTALGTGALSVASGATLVIAAGKHLVLDGGINFDADSTLKLGSVDSAQAVLSTTGGWSLGGGLTRNLSAELEAGTRYALLGGLGSASGITLTGQDGYNYSCTTELGADGIYYLTTSDYAGSELTWSNSDAASTWMGGDESLWNKGASASDTGSGSKDTVIFGESGSKDVTVIESGVRVDAMKVQADGYCFGGGRVHANELLVTNGATTSFGEVYTVRQKDEASAACIGRVELGSDHGANTGFIHGMGSGLTHLDNLVLDIAKGATIELKDLLLTESSRITDDPATVAMENVTVALGETNALINGASTLVAGTTLVQAVKGLSLSLAEDSLVVSIFCSALDTVNVTGTSLTLDLSGLAATLGVAWETSQFVSINFGQTPESLARFDVTGLSIQATYGGATYDVWVKEGEQASASTLYVATNTDAVPEPASTTMSLLALGFLAARRRRK